MLITCWEIRINDSNNITTCKRGVVNLVLKDSYNLKIVNIKVMLNLKGLVPVYLIKGIQELIIIFFPLRTKLTSASSSKFSQRKTGFRHFVTAA